MNKTNISVSCRHVNKSFGNANALNDIDLNVRKGELFGVIGPDGAGKTSLLRILTALDKPDNGNIMVEGLDVMANQHIIKTLVGYMPTKFSLYPDLTVEENFNFFAALFNTDVRKNYDAIAHIYGDLQPFKHRRAGKLSGGMKQKLALSCTLIRKPAVLLLDEPTTGVDPVSRKEFWKTLDTLKQAGVTIIVSTPYMDEATQCDRVALMKNGRFLNTDTPQNLVNQFDATLWEVSATNMAKLFNDLQNVNGVKTCFTFGATHHLTVDTTILDVNQLNKQLNALKYSNIHIQQIPATIEDCFMALDSINVKKS